MEEHRKRVLNRLKRIEGQIRGLEKMVEKEAPCADILTQLYAATAAIKNGCRHHWCKHQKMYQ